MGKDRIPRARLDEIQRQFPPAFPRLIDIILDEAQQSDFLESHWYHLYGEILSTLTRAISNTEIMFSVAPQRTFTFVPPQPVFIDRSSRPITRPLNEEGEEEEEEEEEEEDDDNEKNDEGQEDTGDKGNGGNGEDDADGADDADDVDMEFHIDEQDAKMEQIDITLARILGDDPDVSGSTATTGYSEGAVLRTPDFSVYLHNFEDKVNIPVMIVEDKPTSAPRTSKGKLLSMTEGPYEDRRAAAEVEMKKHLKQKKEQLMHLFDEYRNLRFAYYCLTVGEWFRLYEVDRARFFLGGRQKPPTRIKLIWDNGVVDASMLELFATLTQSNKFYL